MKIHQKIYYPLQFIGWGMFTLINLGYNFLVKQTIDFTDCLYALSLFVFGFLSSHCLSWVVERYNWLKLSIFQLFFRSVLACLILAVINVFLLLFISFLTNGLQFNHGFYSITLFILIFSLVYIIWCLFFYGIYFFSNFKKEEIKNLKKETQLKELLFDKLKAQLNPHFMFNSMNVIRALVDEDTEKAKQGITKLSNILRFTLNVDDEKLIRFEEEYKFINDYLDLQKIRFEERLNIELNVSKDAFSFLVPPILLQTLVENAIKHGISKKIEGGTLKFEATVKDNQLHIKISNPGKYVPNQKGNGVKNSIERLNLIFGNDYVFNIQNKQNLVTCNLIIPNLNKI